MLFSTSSHFLPGACVVSLHEPSFHSQRTTSRNVSWDQNQEACQKIHGCIKAPKVILIRLLRKTDIIPHEGIILLNFPPLSRNDFS